jgi:hypothetical protein
MWNLIKMLMARYVGSSQPIGNIRPSPLRKWNSWILSPQTSTSRCVASLGTP